MQADCVLAALLALRATHPEWNHAHLEALGERWLTALALAGRSGFFAYASSDGSRALALERQTCCYHYRRRDGELCSTCPRLEKRERIARLNAERDATLTA
jgi:ferric iron reductase protein FhuF